MSRAHTRLLRNEVNRFRRGPISMRLAPGVSIGQHRKAVREYLAAVERVMNSPVVLRGIEDAVVERMTNAGVHFNCPAC